MQFVETNLNLYFNWFETTYKIENIIEPSRIITINNSMSSPYFVSIIYEKKLLFTSREDCWYRSLTNLY